MRLENLKNPMTDWISIIFKRSTGKECFMGNQVKFDIEEISRIYGKPIPISDDGMDTEDEDDTVDGETS